MSRTLSLVGALCLTWAIHSGVSAEEVLLDFGEEWRYFEGTRDPSAGTTQWTRLGFDDSDWNTGRLGIGYGDGDDATTIEGMRENFSSVYVRKVFNIDDPSSIENLVLTADFDDGFVAYINGTPVAVANVDMHRGPLSYRSLANCNHEAGTPQSFDLGGATSELRAGANVIAAQVLNESLRSSDLSFNVRLTGSVTGPPVVPNLSDYDVTFELSGVGAVPSAGDRLIIPLILSSNQPTSGFSVSIDFDEEQLEAVGGTLLWERPDGRAIDDFAVEVNNDNLTPGNNGTDEGYVVCCGRFTSVDDAANFLPPRYDPPVVQLEFRVREGALAGNTEIVFADGGISGNDAICFGESVRNSVSGEAGLVVPEEAGAFELVGAAFEIGDIQLRKFLRGDANSDGGVNLADAIFTLNHLFSRGYVLACADAADADDSGGVNLADAVFALNYLFVGSVDLPAPTGTQCGADPTDDDDLGCESSSAICR